ncbi:uncharacterized protein LOC143305274 [Osmia lignaria lignaria]|uniref:uncharacterized protein LOC143305274 n=1 Tax=Osmia lignaria lignaria TaxID=1437193 RepID=UPI00402B4158
MSHLEELLYKQTQTLRSIDRALLNFKKLGQAKMTAATTQNRMAMLKEAYIQSQDLDARIAACTDNAAKSSLPYFVDNQFIESEERYQEALDYMAEVLAKATPPPQSTNANSNSTTSKSTIHLPKIQLPTFDGAFTEWESFRDRFTSLVKNNDSLSNIDRLQFLNSSLTGEASRAVSHLPITDKNFDIAWKIITSRYENKQRLISTHLNTLFSIPSVAAENAHDLRALRDGINISLEMLRNLNRPVDKWDDMIVFLATQKLDRSSRKAWEFHLSEATDFPTYEEFDAFLRKRIRALEAMPNPKREKANDVDKCKQFKSRAISTHSATSQKITCPVCQQTHLIYQCPKFLSQPVSERFHFIRKQKRCVNCFSIKHSSAQCQSKHLCKECNQRHNTLLHFPNQKDATPSTSKAESESSENAVEISTHVASNSPKGSCILLSTARVQIRSSQGRSVNARALLDQGSVATLITENLAQTLRLLRTKQPTKIIGIGENQSHASHTAEIIITPSRSDKPAYSTTAIILRSLTRYVPSKNPTNFKWSHLADLELADNEPMSSDPIDIIIGADLYGQFLLPGLRKGSACTPTAQNTTLGWILSGPSQRVSSPSSVGVHHLSVLENLDQDLCRFWQIEDLSAPTITTPENQMCEEHFKTTHSRANDGRYIVRLPFKTQSSINLGESRSVALRCLRSLENRLIRNSAVSKPYQEFLSEYETLGHMKQVDPLPSSHKNCYYIPHHAVIRESSVTTRLRVVFNASRRTSDGTSLNDHLFTGPKLQQDLVSILIRWRQFQYVYTADIEKMYRQILVHPEDTDYQRILWRDSPLKPVNEYQLLTVTYGTASAPYLAIRVLHQLVEDEGANFPQAVSVVQDQAYVDDFIFGGDSVNSLRQLRDQTIDLLAKGGFVLRKWASNNPELMSDINPKNYGLATSKSLQGDETISVLGLTWNPALDQFQFKLSEPINRPQTKRSILSTIAKLFDPLGWIAPIIITGKIYMQTLWSIRCDWDDVPPSTFLQEWKKFCSQLPKLEHISIPRKIAHNIFRSQSLHGFSDASTKAYAAAVYSRNVLYDGTICASLVIAKTRVAPVKTLSVPRLELSAALLLARLLTFVRTALNAPMLESHCWTDSTITLAWLRQPPNRWKTFVANRVAKIQQLIPDVQWHHVPTAENPADCASRGINIDKLETHQLWWSGPPWLIKASNFWPQSIPQTDDDLSHEKRSPALPSLATCVEQWELANRYSSWTKLLRVTAYLIHFIRTLRTRIQSKTNQKLTIISQPTAPPLILKPEVINQAKLFWLKELQSNAFPEEKGALTPTA